MGELKRHLEVNQDSSSDGSSRRLMAEADELRGEQITPGLRRGQALDGASPAGLPDLVIEQPDTDRQKLPVNAADSLPAEEVYRPRALEMPEDPDKLCSSHLRSLYADILRAGRLSEPSDGKPPASNPLADVPPHLVALAGDYAMENPNWYNVAVKGYDIYYRDFDDTPGRVTAGDPHAFKEPDVFKEPVAPEKPAGNCPCCMDDYYKAIFNKWQVRGHLAGDPDPSLTDVPADDLTMAKLRGSQLGWGRKYVPE